MTNTPHTSGDSGAAPTISDELKPCPFCPDGGKPGARAVGGFTFIECSVCEATGPGFKKSFENAITAWNLRSASAAPVEGVGQAKPVEAPTGEKVEAFCICGHTLSKHSKSAGVCYKVGCACCSYRAAEASATRDEQIYAMCAYVRGMECKKCPARVDTLYGNGQPGCHAVAEETLKKARDILRTDTAPCGVTITEDEREALKYAALELDAASSASQEPFKATCAIHAYTLRSLAARLSKGERG